MRDYGSGTRFRHSFRCFVYVSSWLISDYLTTTKSLPLRRAKQTLYWKNLLIGASRCDFVASKKAKVLNEKQALDWLIIHGTLAMRQQRGLIGLQQNANIMVPWERSGLYFFYGWNSRARGRNRIADKQFVDCRRKFGDQNVKSALKYPPVFNCYSNTLLLLNKTWICTGILNYWMPIHALLETAVFCGFAKWSSEYVFIIPGTYPVSGAESWIYTRLKPQSDNFVAVTGDGAGA